MLVLQKDLNLFRTQHSVLSNNPTRSGMHLTLKVYDLSPYHCYSHNYTKYNPSRHAVCKNYFVDKKIKTRFFSNITPSDTEMHWVKRIK